MRFQDHGLVIAVFAMSVFATPYRASSAPAIVFAPTPQQSFTEAYKTLEESLPEGAGLFITTDLVFDATHRLTEGLATAVELHTLLPALKGMLDALDVSLAAATPEVAEEELLESHAMARGYVLTARALLAGDADGALGDAPETVGSRVREELALIAAREGFAFSPVMGHKTDYSQFTIRGRYTRSAELTRYFLAMMWLGSTTFRVEGQYPFGAGDPPDLPPIAGWHEDEAAPLPREGAVEARAWLLLCRLLRLSAPGFAAYHRITGTLCGLYGPQDDLSAEDLAVLPEVAWDTPDSEGLRDFARAASSLAASREPVDGTGLGRLGFVLFGQHAAFDSRLFQRLVSGERQPLPYTGPEDTLPFTAGEIPPRGLVRVFPRSLDLMHVLGSVLARNALEAGYDAAYHGYSDIIREFERRWRERAAPAGLNGLLLEAVAAGLQPVASDTLPAYATSDAWAAKQLLTGLGAWTQLRHDTILYAKQSYTSAPRSASFGGPPPPRVRVEPAPESFAALARLAVRFLEAASLPESYRYSCDALLAYLNLLEEAARFEMRGLALPEDLARRLATPSKTVTGIFKGWPSDTDAPADNMVLVADVHTFTPHVLEQGLGTLLELRVTPEDGAAYTGFVFSHYEFKHPIEERLSNESWRKWVATGELPEMHLWVTPFLVENELDESGA